MTALNQARTRFRELAMLIAGEWTRGTGHSAAAVLDPATEQVLGELPLAAEADLAAAADAAAAAFPGWARTAAIDRRRILMEASRLIRDRSERIAHVMTLEQGKPLPEARGEVIAAAEIFEWYAEEARRLYGRLIPPRQANVRHLVQRDPVGPVAAFTPWNFPALTPARKIAGALAAGCTCVIKPAEETPGTAIELARACVDAGLPAGVLNVVFGVPAEVSEFLIRAPAIRKITFTGSTQVGMHLASLAARHGAKRCTMELGGHAPVLVFDDSDIDLAAQACAASRLRNAGQVCIAASRFFVQRGAHDRFVERFAQAARRAVVGSGLQPESTMGPLANERRLHAMAGFVDDAVRQGGTLVTGGGRIGERGYFFAPTLVTGLADTARMMTEETFGPVAPVVAFDSVEEAVSRANRLPYGLAAYAFTESARTAREVSDGLQVGLLGINTFAVSLAEAPFGGVRESGYGSEGGTEGLDAYLATKFIAHLA
ncbi:NAD-dependent succinate-semialdehyde dehydrogenase [Pigmentiphaga soli]|uniref:NAD-dependent succinate-semialdehyde dehydrogenase n=1 Tax=Pigmentiphaga soli TaxID=1007095 RepID=A0ABP8H1P1_9BURK